MLVKTLILIALIVLSMGCVGNHANGPIRSIASVTESEATLILDLEDKLTQIHIYQVIGQNQLLMVNKESDGKSAYLKLQAINSQVEKTENKITDVVKELKKDQKNKTTQSKLTAIMCRIVMFSEKSTIHAYSVKKLMLYLNIGSKSVLKELSRTEIEKEIALLRSSNQYQVFEQNIEHLSFMLESNKTVEVSSKLQKSASPNRKI